MPPTTRRRNAVATYALRAAIVLTLKEADGKAMTVAQIVTALRQRGVVIPGRASKTISDATRTDIRMGRIVRMGRGNYAFRRLPRSTGYDMQRRVAAYIANPNARRPRYGTVAGTEET